MSTKQKLVPLLDRLTIIEDDSEKQTKGGILIPDKNKKEYATGTIIAMGELVQEAKVDAQCVFNPEMATKVEVDDQEYVIIKESEVYAYYEDK